MNISFMGKHDYRNGIHRTDSAPRRPHRTDARAGKHYDDPNVRKNEHGDTFKPTGEAEIAKQKRAQNAQRRKQAAWANRALGAAAALLIMAGAKGCSATIDQIKGPQPNYDAMGHSIMEVSEWADTDVKAILLANHLEDPDAEVTNIILPTPYEMYGEKLEKLQEELKTAKGSKHEKLQEEYTLLKSRQIAQDNVGSVYTDGKWLYIIPDGYCSVERAKSVFGIKDGVIKSHNKLEFQWGFNEDAPDHPWYKDYSDSMVPSSGIRVLIGEVGHYKK